MTHVFYRPSRLTQNETLLNEPFELEGKAYSRLSEFAARHRIDTFKLPRLMRHTMDLNGRTPAKLAALLIAGEGS